MQMMMKELLYFHGQTMSINLTNWSISKNGVHPPHPTFYFVCHSYGVQCKFAKQDLKFS